MASAIIMMATNMVLLSTGQLNVQFCPCGVSLSFSIQGRPVLVASAHLPNSWHSNDDAFEFALEDLSAAMQQCAAHRCPWIFLGMDANVQMVESYDLHIPTDYMRYS